MEENNIEGMEKNQKWEGVKKENRKGRRAGIKERWSKKGRK